MGSETVQELYLDIMRELGINLGRAMLVEGFTTPDYDSAVSAFREYTKRRERPLSVDFLEFMTADPIAIISRLAKIRNLFVYNIDLFGNGIDPDKATCGMRGLRKTLNESCINSDGMTQLMFARPSANLDYNSRKGYTFHDNHPLGNWCDFYYVEGGRLVHSHSPIQHRG
jgi:hypothetical protein